MQTGSSLLRMFLKKVSIQIFKTTFKSLQKLSSLFRLTKATRCRLSRKPSSFHWVKQVKRAAALSSISRILFNPETVKSQIKGGIYSVKQVKRAAALSLILRFKGRPRRLIIREPSVSVVRTTSLLRRRGREG